MICLVNYLTTWTNLSISDFFMMGDHIARINKFYRFFTKEVTVNFLVKSLRDVVNFCYRKDPIDIRADDEYLQIKVLVRVYYKKSQEDRAFACLFSP